MDDNWPISRTTLRAAGRLIDLALDCLSESLEDGKSIFEVIGPLDGSVTVGSQASLLFYLNGILSLNAGYYYMHGVISEVTEDTVVIGSPAVMGMEKHPSRVSLDRGVIEEWIGEAPSPKAALSAKMMAGMRLVSPAVVYWLLQTAADILASSPEIPGVREASILVATAFDAVRKEYVPSPQMMERFTGTVVGVGIGFVTLKNIKLANGESIADQFVLRSSDQPDVGSTYEFSHHLDMVLGCWELPDMDRTEHDLEGEECPATILWLDK